MARNEEKAALTNAGTGQSLEKQYNAQSQGVLNGMLPTLQQEVTNPQGFTPAETASMNTAAQQSAGGSMAGAVGEGNLMAARTRNAGAFAPALDRAAQTSGAQLSNAALGVQNKNAMLKEQQRQSGLKGMLGLYGEDTGATLGALNSSNQAVNAGTGAASQENSMIQSWMPWNMGNMLHA